MKKVKTAVRLLWLAVLMTPLCAAVLCGQSGSGDTFSESSADNFFGVGGRAVGMSEAVTASVNDGTALFYNPAALARITRPEFYAALSHERIKCVSDWPSASASRSATDDFSKTRLGSLLLSVPVPTYRGSLVVSLGVNRTKSFDHTFAFTSGAVGIATEDALEQATGGIKEWSAGAAVQISPHLAVGGSLIYYRGSEDYLWDYQSDQDFVTLRYVDNISSKYSGVGVRLGMTAEANRYLTLGLTIDSPMRYHVEQDWTSGTYTNGSYEEVYGYYEYDLQHPFIFTAGAALQVSTLTLEADLGYADWSQLEYTSEADKADNKALQKYYTDAVQFRAGAEYVFPQYGFVLRGGFKHDPLPIAGTSMSNQIEKDRNSFSAGLGLLIDRVIMLDAAYAHVQYKMYDGGRDITEKFTSDRVMLSLGYRI